MTTKPKGRATPAPRRTLSDLLTAARPALHAAGWTTRISVADHPHDGGAYVHTVDLIHIDSGIAITGTSTTSAADAFAVCTAIMQQQVTALGALGEAIVAANDQ